MKSTITIVLGGLLFAGTSLASEPAPQHNASAPAAAGLKVGIDAKTGKRRQLTSEESASLDAKAAAMSKAARVSRAKDGVAIPATFAESVAGGIDKGGISGYLAPVEAMSSITATVDANGKMVLSENGQPMQHAEELASE